jgi:chaperonin GroES
MKIEPLSDRVVVEKTEEAEEMIGSIIIPDTAKEQPNQGTVVAVGSGRISKKGENLPMTVKVGDKVLYETGTDVKVDGKEYLIMRESSILAIVR